MTIFSTIGFEKGVAALKISQNDIFRGKMFRLKGEGCNPRDLPPKSANAHRRIILDAPANVALRAERNDILI